MDSEGDKSFIILTGFRSRYFLTHTDPQPARKVVWAVGLQSVSNAFWMHLHVAFLRLHSPRCMKWLSQNEASEPMTSVLPWAPCSIVTTTVRITVEGAPIYLLILHSNLPPIVSKTPRYLTPFTWSSYFLSTWRGRSTVSQQRTLTWRCWPSSHLFHIRLQKTVLACSGNHSPVKPTELHCGEIAEMKPCGSLFTYSVTVRFSGSHYYLNTWNGNGIVDMKVTGI